VRFRAVLFDLDGTLLDTLEDIALTMNSVFGRRGYPPFSLTECRLMVGEGMEVLVRRAVLALVRRADEDEDESEGVDDGMVAAIVREFRTEYKNAWRAHSRPYPGVFGLLEGLRARGVRMAVLSNKPHPFTEEMTRELLPFDFDIVRGAMPGVPYKPDPSAALAIAAEMGFPPAEFVFVGDTSVDMKTARAAGMFPAGVLWGFRDAEELVSSGAAVLIASPMDLMRVLDEG
jgi:phosphoglycolate phosphatase